MDQDDPKPNRKSRSAHSVHNGGPIAVLWQCGMGVACTNLSRPGLHAEYSNGAVCRGAAAPHALFDFAAFAWKIEQEREPHKVHRLSSAESVAIRCHGHGGGHALLQSGRSASLPL